MMFHHTHILFVLIICTDPLQSVFMGAAKALETVLENLTLTHDGPCVTGADGACVVEPCNAQYRKLKIQNKNVRERILNVDGALSLLEAAGFGFGTENSTLELTPDKALHAAHSALSALRRLRTRRENPPTPFIECRQCKAAIPVPIHCRKCGHHYCVMHRNQFDHDCEKRILDKQRRETRERKKTDERLLKERKKLEDTKETPIHRGEIVEEISSNSLQRDKSEGKDCLAASTQGKAVDDVISVKPPPVSMSEQKTTQGSHNLSSKLKSVAAAVCLLSVPFLLPSSATFNGRDFALPVPMLTVGVTWVLSVFIATSFWRYR